MIETYKTYKLPFKMGVAKDFKNKPKVVSGKRLTYAALELGVGSALELQPIKLKGPAIKDDFQDFKIGINGQLKRNK